MNHLAYMAKKEAKTLTEWDKFMHGSPFEKISDFEEDEN